MRRAVHGLVTATLVSALLGAGSAPAFATDTTPLPPDDRAAQSSGPLAAPTSAPNSEPLEDGLGSVPAPANDDGEQEPGPDSGDDGGGDETAADDADAPEEEAADEAPADTVTDDAPGPLSSAGTAEPISTVTVSPAMLPFVRSIPAPTRPSCGAERCAAIDFARHGSAILPMVTTAAANLQVPEPASAPVHVHPNTQPPVSDAVVVTVAAVLLLVIAAGATLTVRRVRFARE